MSMTESDSRTDVVRAVFAAGDRGDVAELLTLLTDDVLRVSGNADPVVGKEAVQAGSRKFLSAMKAVEHEIHEIWHAAEDKDVLIARATVHYTKYDGTIVSLPSCNVFRMRGDLVAEYRIYMDATPATAPTGSVSRS